MQALRFSAAALLLACAPQPALVGDPAPPIERPKPSLTTPEDRGEPSPPPPEASAPIVDEEEKLRFVRVLEAPAHGIAFGRRDAVAIIGDDVWLDDGKGMRKLPAPGMPLADVQVHFGRDNAPRLLGYARDDGALKGVYRRWRNQTWQTGNDEIGKLSAGTAPFFGVLGWDDPEVVCRVGQFCWVKRLTGWKQVTPPPGLPRVLLAQSDAWAFESAALWHLVADSEFRAVGGALPFHDATSLWAFGAGDVWVGTSSGVLHHFDGSTWVASPSPVGAAHGLWAADPENLWLVGEGGAARFDGKTWRRAKGTFGMLRFVAGRSADDVWLAGATGVWQGRTPTSG